MARAPSGPERGPIRPSDSFGTPQPKYEKHSVPPRPLTSVKAADR